MACSFDMRFLAVCSGSRGSVPDELVYRSIRTGLQIPPGRYYLADGGFALCEELLVPYSGVSYHPTESAVQPPMNEKELFNLRHASARSVIERTFGVLMSRFHILILPSKYDMGIQILIPPALCALHNFIHHHDRSDILNFAKETGYLLDGKKFEIDLGELNSDAARHQARSRTSKSRDGTARAMWRQEYIPWRNDAETLP